MQSKIIRLTLFSAVIAVGSLAMPRTSDAVWSYYGTNTVATTTNYRPLLFPRVRGYGPYGVARTSYYAPRTTYYRPTVAYYGAPRVAYYGSPVVASSGCSTCYRPTPVTAYRWSYSRVARTSYRPSTTCDSCSGTCVTTMKPVTSRSLLPWLHRVPVTSYSAPACSTCVTAAPACSTCVSAAPACATCVSLGSTCSSCAAGGGTITDETPQPRLSQSEGNTTYRQETKSVVTEKARTTDEASSPEPEPKVKQMKSLKSLQLIDANDKTARRVELSNIRHASLKQEVKRTSLPTLDTSGWHTAR